jgi:hypothetical protein
MDEIYQNGMVTFIDSSITLKTKIYWEHFTGTVCVPSDSLRADLLRLKFENATDYMESDRFDYQRRGDLFVISDSIHKKWDGLIENYYYGDKSLSNNKKKYFFQGKIQFRDSLENKEEYWQDSTYINQWNSVIYWSQTFEFQVDKILNY